MAASVAADGAPALCVEPAGTRRSARTDETADGPPDGRLDPGVGGQCGGNRTATPRAIPMIVRSDHSRRAARLRQAWADRPPTGQRPS